MKRLFLLVAIMAMVLPSCKKINEAIDDLDNRLNKLEQETIPSIDEQISAINTTLGNLDAMDKELKGYIDNLTTTASSLQEQINATNSKIDEVKIALQGEISTAKADVLAQLEALETELKNELATINITIDALKAKDTELDNKIAELRSYVDTELGETTDWVNATFATLEQYNALVAEIATIKEQIKAINQSITELESRLTTKIKEDIATAVSTLNADIQQKVKDITDAYTNAIKSAKEEITSAYTTAIQNAINALDSSLKAWVGEQLANYYTIAEVNAKISALQTAINEGDAKLQEELKSLKSQLETTATEITTAYKKAIEEAITTNNGVIDTKIANEIALVNQRITNEVATINAKIAEIESRLDNVEAKIAELLARIQSISYIPTYGDGKATVISDGSKSQVTLDFEVSPKDAVVELAKVWQSAVSVKAIYTQTRAVSFIDMPIVKFESDPVNGVISVTASGENLSAEFFDGTQTVSARLSISDGNNSIVSDYVTMVAKKVTNEEIGGLSNTEIWYTSTDEQIVEPLATDVSLISNTYYNGIGKIVLSGRVATISASMFQNCKTLTSVSIPSEITYIGDQAFYGCSALVRVYVLSNIPPILGEKTFVNTSSKLSIRVSSGYADLYKVEWSKYASRILDPTQKDNVVYYTTSNNMPLELDLSAWSVGVISHTYENGEGVITFAERLTAIGNAFSNSEYLVSIMIPCGVREISYNAFSNCTSLSIVAISGEVLLSMNAFQGCSSLPKLYLVMSNLPSAYDMGYSNMDENWECILRYVNDIYVPTYLLESYRTTYPWDQLTDKYIAY